MLNYRIINKDDEPIDFCLEENHTELELILKIKELTGREIVMLTDEEVKSLGIIH